MIIERTRNEERIRQLEQRLTDTQALLQQQSVQFNPLPPQQIRGLEPPKPDTFDGKNVDTFLFSIENAFQYYQVEGRNKIQTAVNYFRYASLNWFRYVSIHHNINDLSWTEFKAMMIRQFKTANDERIIRNKLNSLRQFSGVAKYNDIFNSLIIQLPTMDEATKVDFYCRSLKTNVQLQVAIKEPATLEEAQQVALRVDEILNTVRDNRVQQSNTNSHSRITETDTTTTSFLIPDTISLKQINLAQYNYNYNQQKQKQSEWKPKYGNWNNNYKFNHPNRFINQRQNWNNNNNYNSSNRDNHSRFNSKQQIQQQNKVSNITSVNDEQQIEDVCESNDSIVFRSSEDRLNTIVCQVKSQNEELNSVGPSNQKLIVIQGSIFNEAPVEVSILVDCGATCNVISQSLVDKFSMTTTQLNHVNSIQLANGMKQTMQSINPHHSYY